MPTGPEPFNLRRPDHLAALDAEIGRLGPALVAFDPITAFLGYTDSHQDAAVRSVLAPLAGLASRRGCALIAIVHLRKSGADRALHRVSGSIAFTAAARSVLLAGHDADNEEARALVSLKSNLSAPPVALGYRLVERDGVAAIEWTDESDLSGDRLLAARAEDEPGAAEGFGSAGTWFWSLAKGGQGSRPSMGADPLAHNDQLQGGKEDADGAWSIEVQACALAPYGPEGEL